MEECEIDNDGNITCPHCGHKYTADGNCNQAPAPEGSGGCIRICYCPSCKKECCAERDSYRLKLS